MRCQDFPTTNVLDKNRFYTTDAMKKKRFQSVFSTALSVSTMKHGFRAPGDYLCKSCPGQSSTETQAGSDSPPLPHCPDLLCWEGNSHFLVLCHENTSLPSYSLYVCLCVYASNKPEAPEVKKDPLTNHIFQHPPANPDFSSVRSSSPRFRFSRGKRKPRKKHTGPALIQCAPQSP